MVAKQILFESWNCHHIPLRFVLLIMTCDACHGIMNLMVCTQVYGNLFKSMVAFELCFSACAKKKEASLICNFAWNEIIKHGKAVDMFSLKDQRILV